MDDETWLRITQKLAEREAARQAKALQNARQYADAAEAFRAEARREDGQATGQTTEQTVEAARRNSKRAASMARGAANASGTAQANYPSLLKQLSTYVEAYRLDPRFLARVRNQLTGAQLSRKPWDADAKEPIPHFRLVNFPAPENVPSARYVPGAGNDAFREGLSVGVMIHYVARPEQPGGQLQRHHVARVERVSDPKRGTVDLLVLSSYRYYTVEDVPHFATTQAGDDIDAKGTWHWPESLNHYDP